jgi:hypothetical protein
MGTKGKNYSLTGSFSTTGKLLVIAVFLLGKSRGLPLEKDAVIDFDFGRLQDALKSRGRVIQPSQEMTSDHSQCNIASY